MSKTQVTKEVESKSQRQSLCFMTAAEMSKTQVTKEVESKSQLLDWFNSHDARCQRPKLLKKLKANHNVQCPHDQQQQDVKDPSY